MDTAESDPPDKLIVVQIARIALVSVTITIAAWLVTNYILDALSAAFFHWIDTTLTRKMASRTYGRTALPLRSHHKLSVSTATPLS
jgi:hypothetical protein